jgi:hypothetical protein
MTGGVGVVKDNDEGLRMNKHILKYLLTSL